MPPQLISADLIRDITSKARLSPRLRMNHNFHSAAQDNPHRFLNVFLKGSYAVPHRHSQPPKSESFLVLEGRMVAVIFNDDGTVLARHLMGPGEEAMGIDLEAGVWHTVAALSDVAVCYEVKPGPWDPTSDKEFAAWAPPEGDHAVPAYLDSLTAGL